ncbi:MAG: phosphatidylserine decarboxylase family protein [Bacteroidales bacterium]
MKIHKEGYKIIAYTGLLLIALLIGLNSFISGIAWFIVAIIFIIFEFFIIRFFRIHKRSFLKQDNQIIASADGTIVAIEKVFESEILNAECIQVSTFMSINNAHVNRYPISGKVLTKKHHKGSYLVANHPKSSVLNERMSILIETKNEELVLVRQVAGFVARRIVCYAKVNQEVEQSKELGFIKFGSRVDLFLPLDTQINVKLNDKVKAGISIIATL